MNIKSTAKASQVNISIEEIGKEIILSIRDDGRPRWFDKDPSNQFQSSIKARAASMGALFELHFNSSYGNKITIKIPKDNSKH